jgi:phospholipid/cholesterol/gamma-HCH transport system ATP-binding protein
MIQVRDLYKSFDGMPVLKGINLEIKNNESLVILGPSGQGKTVFIKTLVRLIKPDSGEIHYDQENILTFSRKKLYHFLDRIAFVFQNSALLDFLSVQDNLRLFMVMHKSFPEKEVNRRVLEALHFVGLDDEVLEKFPEELSGGMRKRVAIARAMIKRPNYIFYDEPTTGLDQSNADKVSELINMLKKEISATSIIVTHDIKLMRDVADRVALLKEGNVSFVGRRDEISDQMLDFLYE